LEQLVPDRGTKTESAIKQLEQVDNVVQLKLGGDVRTVDEILSGTSLSKTEGGEVKTVNWADL
jgi:hypothetical protein